LDSVEQRRLVLSTVLNAGDSPAGATTEDRRRHEQLLEARKTLRGVELSAEMLQRCVDLARQFGADGHRGDLMLALAARALAARAGVKRVTKAHLSEVAPLALQHRRRVPGQRELTPWTETDNAEVERVFAQ
jgi:magnesium chelatase subunit I